MEKSSSSNARNILKESLLSIQNNTQLPKYWYSLLAHHDEPYGAACLASVTIQQMYTLLIECGLAKQSPTKNTPKYFREKFNNFLNENHVLSKLEQDTF